MAITGFFCTRSKFLRFLSLFFPFSSPFPRVGYAEEEKTWAKSGFTRASRWCPEETSCSSDTRREPSALFFHPFSLLRLFESGPGGQGAENKLFPPPLSFSSLLPSGGAVKRAEEKKLRNSRRRRRLSFFFLSLFFFLESRVLVRPDWNSRMTGDAFCVFPSKNLARCFQWPQRFHFRAWLLTLPFLSTFLRGGFLRASPFSFLSFSSFPLFIFQHPGHGKDSAAKPVPLIVGILVFFPAPCPLWVPVQRETDQI